MTCKQSIQQACTQARIYQGLCYLINNSILGAANVKNKLKCYMELCKGTLANEDGLELFSRVT